jgi:putative glutamine amidotransferase
MKRVLAICGSPEDWGPDDSRPYEEALRDAGLKPILISPGEQPPSDYSGLLLMGGSDVNPARYGEAPVAETENPDDARDDVECAIIRKALAQDLPILAICRGIQILNVQHGGTLIQHLPATEHHRVRTPDRGLPAHHVELLPGTRLATIAGESRTWDVNSRHHQAIGRLGSGLCVSGRDPFDGTIEAVERPDKRFVIGVQWHPENQIARKDGQAKKLFRAFAAAL